MLNNLGAFLDSLWPVVGGALVVALLTALWQDWQLSLHPRRPTFARRQTDREAD